jgi:uncharacterized protein with ATP-grasp and redox domains
MHTSIDCLPCFDSMAQREALLACPGDPVAQAAILDAWKLRLRDLDLDVPPPVIACTLSGLVAAMSDGRDLYVEDKREANAAALRLMPALRGSLAREKSSRDGDSLALALELAVVGNYIDRGIDLDVDWEAELGAVGRTMSLRSVAEFSGLAKDGAQVLILGDNAGEIVLDMLVVEELLARGCMVTYAVRSRPILNDATMDDAVSVGMADLCHVIESGVDTPGTVLGRCSPEFLDRMHRADVILSKGQGNFESLQGVWPGAFCAFKIKCPRVAQEAGLAFGSSAFVKSHDGGMGEGK